MLKEREFQADLSIASSQYSRERDYWLNRFAGELTRSHFPYDRNKKSNKAEPRMDSFTFDLPPEQVRRLMKLSRGSDYTLLMTLIAAVVALLSRYTGNRDIISGTTIYTQDTQDEFINTVLPLRICVPDHMSFKELLLEVRQTIIEAEEHQNYAIEALLYQLNLPGYNDGFPLFDVAVLLENVQCEAYLQPVRVNVILVFRREKERLTGILKYNPGRYRDDSARQWVRHLTMLMECLVADIDGEIDTPYLMTDVEREQILKHFNDTAVEYNDRRTIEQWFHEQSEAAVDTVAVVGGSDNFVTYMGINDRSARLSLRLRQKGAGTGVIIAIMTERSIQMIVGILAILKAGGAYLPLDPFGPVKRSLYMLMDSSAGLLLTSRNLAMDAAALEDFPGETLFIGEEESLSVTHETVSGHNEAAVSRKSSRPVYVLYTSGSTGRPKGVILSQRSLVNLVTGLEERIYYRYVRPLKVAVVSTFVFDASVKQIFAALLLGHTLHIVPEDTRADGHRLLDYLKIFSIDISDGTPIHIRLLLEAGLGRTGGLCLKHLLIGGESLSGTVLGEFFDRYGENPPVVTNVYGPTECCVDATAYDITPETLDRFEGVPIGRPLPNVRIFILGARNQLQPPGVGGELHVGGDGVAAGYLNCPQLTADKFTFPTWLRNSINIRLYSTGDLARWLPHGNIAFFGRGDGQLKIRGYRIEVEEIEQQMLRYPGIKEAVVVPRGAQSDDKYLCAYFTAAETDRIETREIRNYLSQTLNDYMIPACFVEIESIPLTRNGKIDRRSLPEPEFAGEGNSYIAPRDGMEEKLVEIWSQVLKLDRGEIGIDRNFFDSGGHSLRATIMITRIHQIFDTWIPLQEIFKTPTIRGISTFIKQNRKEQFVSILPVEKREYYHLSSTQKRLFTVQQMDETSTGLTLLAPMLLQGDLDLDRLETVLLTLINRHESLRSSFPLVDGEPRQQIHDIIRFNLEKYRLEAETAVEDFIVKTFNRPFDLEIPPLFRVAVIKLTDRRHILVVNQHHIIADGTSMGILVKEFMRLYEGETVPSLPVRYVDYIAWQNSPEQKKISEQHERYWLSRLDGEIPRLYLPTDFPRPAIRSFAGSSLQFNLSPERTASIRDLVSSENVTLHIFLLAVFNVFLHKITGQEDILVGSPIANRLHADLHSLVGTFPNILVLRNYPRGQRTFVDFLEETGKSTLEAYDNQAYKLEELMDRVMVRRDAGRHSIFDIYFHLDNVEDPVIKIRDLCLTPIAIPLKTARYDLALVVRERKADIEMMAEYSTLLFKEDTIKVFFNNLQEVIDSVLENRAIRLQDITITYTPPEQAATDGETAVADESVPAYVPPGDKVEQALADIWSEVLSRPAVGIDADFFRLGGHSLKASLVTAGIFKKLGVKIPLRVIFERPTIRELAGYIRSAEADRFLSINPVEEREYYPVSTAQKSIYIQHQKKKNNLGYNFSRLFLMQGEISVQEVENVFRILIDRHESFRTSFHLLKGEPVQRIHRAVDFRVTALDAIASEIAKVLSSFVRPFDLTEAPLLRIGIARVEVTKYVLIIDLHHTIYDGYSIGILLGEFLVLYGGKQKLSRPAVRYRDFAVWQNLGEVKKAMRDQAQYWSRELDGDLPRLNLPADYPRPQQQSFRGAVLDFNFGIPETASLRTMAEQEQVTLFMILLSVFYVLLSRLSGQEDIVVGTPVAARRHADLRKVIGMFVNTLPLRNFPEGGKTFREFLRETKDRVLQAFDNQDYHFMQLVDDLHPAVSREPGRHPLFDVMFEFLGFEESSALEPVLRQTGKKIRIETLDYEKRLSHFDILVLAHEGYDNIDVTVEYATDLFKKKSIEKIARYYQSILNQFIDNVQLQLKDVTIPHDFLEARSPIPVEAEADWTL